MQLINLPTIKIVRTSSIASDPSIETQLTVKPIAPRVWDEFLQLQISPATRRSYAAGLRDFFRREFQVQRFAGLRGTIAAVCKPVT